MKLISQRDPVHAKDKLGASTLTVARWGCTTATLSMLSDYFDCYKSVTEIAHNVHNYTWDGLIIWKNLSFENMKFEKREYRYNRENILDALSDPDRAVILQVADGAHWVVAYSTKMFSLDIAVADPLELPCKIVPVFKKWKNITGAAYFRRADTEKLERKVLNVDPVITKTLIKAEDKPEIFFYNGKKKFLYPNWYTFIELGGRMDSVQVLPSFIVDEIPSGRNITNVKP